MVGTERTFPLKFSYKITARKNDAAYLQFFMEAKCATVATMWSRAHNSFVRSAEPDLQHFHLTFHYTEYHVIPFNLSPWWTSVRVTSWSASGKLLSNACEVKSLCIGIINFGVLIFYVCQKAFCVTNVLKWYLCANTSAASQSDWSCSVHHNLEHQPIAKHLQIILAASNLFFINGLLF